MGASVVDELVCFSLYAASRATAQTYRTLLAPWDLTYPQYLVLTVLWNEGPVTVGMLGERLELDSGTLSPLLRRMENAGIVIRTRSADDERVVTASLTERGTALRQDLAHIPSCIASGMGLDVDGAKQLLDVLHRLTDGMQQTTAEARERPTDTGARERPTDTEARERPATTGADPRPAT